MKRQLCPCVTCEVDRERGEPLSVVRWRATTGAVAGLYYHPRAPRFSVERREDAMVYGPRHPFGSLFDRIEIEGAS